MADDNTVYIGKKDIMQYVLALVAQFHSSNEVSVKARGRNISMAVDVVEIVRNRYVPDAKVRTIEIATEKLTGEDGKTANVSSIEIFLTKEEGAAPKGEPDRGGRRETEDPGRTRTRAPREP